jgi:hypothetical protein
MCDFSEISNPNVTFIPHESTDKFVVQPCYGRAHLTPCDTVVGRQVVAVALPTRVVVGAAINKYSADDRMEMAFLSHGSPKLEHGM